MRDGTLPARRGRVRTVAILLTLLTFGCAELRAPTRTDMIEVTPSPAPPSLVPSPSSADARALHPRPNRWRALVIGGAIALAIGVPFIVGGALGLEHQRAADAAADAQCMAQGGWLCGLGDGFDELPYDGLITLGSMSSAVGVTLLLVGAAHYDQRDR